MKPHRPILAIIATLVAGGAFASPASAGAGNGATKVNQEYCQTFYLPNGNPYTTACFDLNYVVKTTVTPSGNTSFVANGKNTITSYGHTTGCNFLGETQFHDHYLLKDGVLHERGDQQETSFTQNCPNGPQQKCTYTRRAHLVDGKFQYLIEDFECVPLEQ